MNFFLARQGGMIIPLMQFKIFFTYTLSYNLGIGKMSEKKYAPIETHTLEAWKIAL